MIEVSGVRSSWLMLARKADLAADPASALRVASSSSASNSLVWVTLRMMSTNSIGSPCSSMIMIGLDSIQIHSPPLFLAR